MKNIKLTLEVNGVDITREYQLDNDSFLNYEWNDVLNDMKDSIEDNQMSEQEMENFINDNYNIVEDIAFKEGDLDMVLDDDLPDAVDAFVADSDVKELYEKVVGKLNK